MGERVTFVRGFLSLHETYTATVNAMDESHTPLRSRTRTFILFWISAITGVAMYVTQLILVERGDLPRPLPTGDSVGLVTMGVEIALGVLALALLPAAIRHDPMETSRNRRLDPVDCRTRTHLQPARA